MRLSLALLAVLLPAPVATGQYSFRNLTVPAGTTVVDWMGKPALCILVPTPFVNAFASFDWRHPTWAPGPEVLLELHAYGVLEQRACALGNSAKISSYDIGTYAPINYMSVTNLGWSVWWPQGPNKIQLGQNRYNMNPTHFWVDYCPYMGPCGTCGVLGNDGPQYAAFVATLILR